MKVTDYDEFDYDYKQYWGEREYEDMAERMVLKKYLKNVKTKYLIDIGGSYGRLIDLYYDKCEFPIIVDYSLKTLQRYQREILEKYPNAMLIAANAYHLPFADSSIGCSLSVRVMHHLENSDQFFSEVKRITKNKGFFILEFANKMHIKARLRWLFTFQFKNFSLDPYQQPTKGNFEGSAKGEDAIFLNYHPKFIKNLLAKNSFKVLKSTGCSFFRVGFLKRVFNISQLLFFENMTQNSLSWTNVSPSIVFMGEKRHAKNPLVTYETEGDVFCCPSCKKTISLIGGETFCDGCKINLKKKEGIWDLRI